MTMVRLWGELLVRRRRGADDLEQIFRIFRGAQPAAADRFAEKAISGDPLTGRADYHH